MKTLLKFSLLALATLTLWSCEKDKGYEDPGMDVTANNIAGTWYLSEANGLQLAEGSYVYINFERKDTKFTIYDNLASSGARKLTGRFAIYMDEAIGSIIWGTYDYDKGDWQNRYIVRDLSSTSMTWVAKNDPTDVSIYKRCDKIPDDIVILGE